MQFEKSICYTETSNNLPKEMHRTGNACCVCTIFVTLHV